MHFLTSLIILFGFLAILIVGLVNVVQSLSGMSIHVSPQLAPTPHSPAAGVEETLANTTAEYESNPTEMSEAG
jgi:hypothetical protein